MDTMTRVDGKFYEVATGGSLAERLVIRARNQMYADFLAHARPNAGSSILDVGISDVLGDAANALERLYPYPERITAVGLGTAEEFQAAFPAVSYRRIVPGEPLPFADRSFDIATSNAVLEHVGSEAAQRFFVSELARVARLVFIAVPNRFFPVEHHTAIPFLHWTGPTFRLACAVTGKTSWTDPSNLILMSKARLRSLVPPGVTAEIGVTGLPLGPFSSGLYLKFTP